MKIPLFAYLVQRYGSHRLRRIMRGYRFLKDSKSLSQIADVNRELTNQPLKIKEKHLSKHIFGEGIGKAKLICRQYLLIRVAGLNLNKALLYALGKAGSPLIYYLPPEWRKNIRNRGFKVASLRTALLWNAFVGMMLAYGVLKIVKIIKFPFYFFYYQINKLSHYQIIKFFILSICFCLFTSLILSAVFVK